ncbi:KilA-N domain-containing protein, partial [Acetobacter pasteurianus]|nr:KilA-N domain-containing protein [Acetobacter pasteurianus]
QQAQQQMLVQAFGSPSAMLYSHSSIPLYQLSYSSAIPPNPPNPPTMSMPNFSAQIRNQHLQFLKQQKQVQQLAMPYGDQLISSPLTKRAKHLSTFSNRDQQSRATSISSNIPQIDYPENVIRPKVATTRWDDENTNCYQVRARNILVSRREDTNYINCTKLLNVVGMTRGKRDGILKTEKVKQVVKVGSMNLKGVWIPFDRAYEIARNEGVDSILYPLFVKNIKEYFLTKGHKLKSEDDLSEEQVLKQNSEEANNYKILEDADSSSFGKGSGEDEGGRVEEGEEDAEVEDKGETDEEEEDDEEQQQQQQQQQQQRQQQEENDEDEGEECTSNGYPTSLSSLEPKYSTADYFDRTLHSSALNASSGNNNGHNNGHGGDVGGQNGNAAKEGLIYGEALHDTLLRVPKTL